jgi:hypothetical protein
MLNVIRLQTQRISITLQIDSKINHKDRRDRKDKTIFMPFTIFMVPFFWNFDIAVPWDAIIHSVPVPLPVPELPAILSWSKPSMGLLFSVFGHGHGHGHGKCKMGRYQNKPLDAWNLRKSRVF